MLMENVNFDIWHYSSIYENSVSESLMALLNWCLRTKDTLSA